MNSGRFRPGHCANPAGRPKGSVSPKRLVELNVRPHLQTLVENTLASALKGDAQASAALVRLYAETHGK